MLTALDLYLATSTASATQMVVYASVGIACLGAFFWGGGNVLDHVFAVRDAHRAAR